MLNIMKSQIYQLKKDKLIVFVFIAVFFMQNFNILMDKFLGMEETTTDIYVVSNGIFIAFNAVLFVLILTAQLCNADFMDKTTNYELMSGHQRKEVYLGRVIPCIIICIIGGVFMMVSPVIISLILNGWGTKLDAGEIILRGVLLIFPMLRLICEFIFLSFLIKNSYIVMILGYFVFMFGSSAILFLPDSQSLILGVSNINELCFVDIWVTYGLEEDMNYIYEASLDISQIVGTIIISIIMSVISLYLGYVFFKNDDLN